MAPATLLCFHWHSDPVGKFTYICHFKRDERKAKKIKNKTKQNEQRDKETKTHAFILIAQDVFVALAVQTRMIKSGKVSDKFDKLFALQNIAKSQGIGFTLDFGSKIYRDLTKSATFQFGFMRASA